MYYVTATDKFMSGWGPAKGKINKYVIECATYEEADRVFDNISKRPEMKYVNICFNRPRYSQDRYLTTFADASSAPYYFR